MARGPYDDLWQQEPVALALSTLTNRGKEPGTYSAVGAGKKRCYISARAAVI